LSDGPDISFSQQFLSTESALYRSDATNRAEKFDLDTTQTCDTSAQQKHRSSALMKTQQKASKFVEEQRHAGSNRLVICVNRRSHQAIVYEPYRAQDSEEG
jgi:hypothetical protein